MNEIVEFLRRDWDKLVVPLIAFAVTLLIGAIVRRFLVKNLERWAQRTKSNIDDAIIGSLRSPFAMWALILALHVSTQVSVLPPGVTAAIAKCLLVLWIVSLTIVASRVGGILVGAYGTQRGGVLPITSLSRNVVRLLIVGCGALILLNQFGVTITPILTALGVGGLAVALALQDTLANLFAGVYVSIASQIRLGDYIKLDSGEEGYVTDISWRNTSIRMLSNNLVIVPNAKLGQAIVTNYHLPEERMSLLVPVSVSYDSDPEHIERVLLEEATAAAPHIPGMLSEPAPAVRFIPGFGASSLDFTLICQVAEFVDQYAVQHELRKRIFRRFRAEGIDIPFPVRTVYLDRRTGRDTRARREASGR